ncbi:MAG: MFS transporter [Anaerolineae bacterium]|nr:MFS transporter [Anaerolineae bacterium]
MKKLHYGWIVVMVTFVALLVSAGVRTAPSVIIKPLEADFGWTRASISLAVAVSLFAFGFGAPLGGTLVDRFGPRRIMLTGLTLIALGLAPLLALQDLWQLHLLWGLVVGVGTGMVTNVLGATVALRWFNQYRGMVVGIFGAASAAGQLIFVPALIALVTTAGWQSVIALMAFIAAATLIPVVIFMRNRPQDMGLEAVGKATTVSAATDARVTTLREAIKTRDFWLLAASFFVCGYTTNGLIGTHLLPHTLEHGFVEADISWALAIMGVMNIVGTTASGWLSDRFDNRKLLATYYGFRALSLAALPFILEMQGMFLFAIVYGLDWVATVPPTVNLTAQRFGRASLGTLYGWIFCSHMIGAGIASYAGGFFRDALGDYHLIFISAAVLGLVASGLALGIGDVRKKKQAQSQLASV